jgi:hypothetical protein
MIMTTVPPAPLVEVYGFGDASCTCRAAVAQSVSFSVMFGTNEIRAALKSSGENIWGLKGYGSGKGIHLADRCILTNLE